MKQLLFLPLFLFLSLCSIAQYDATGLCNESITLNGGIRSQMGGRSRTYIPIKVPEHCDKVLLSINIADNPYSVDAWGLTTQVLSLLSTYDISSIAELTSGISGNPGTGTIDMIIYTNPKCVEYYLQKASFTCDQYFQRVNSGGGLFTIDIPFPGTTYYLCFRNPSEFNAVYFQVEATAITTKEETAEYDNSNSEYSKEEMQNMIDYYKNYRR